MNRDELFDIWCVPSGRWSPWVKPVLFSFISNTPVLASAPTVSPFAVRALDAHQSIPAVGPAAPPAWDMTGLPTTAQENVALVFDLPGGEAVRLAMSFLPLGFRPVPLYNALPWQEAGGFLLSHEHPPIVNMQDVVQALGAATPELAKAQLSDDAPPVFMLDANRRRAIGPGLPGSFDNRSISFPTDFPSANFLLSWGIERAIVVLQDRDQIEADLTHTLRQWQDGGMRIELKRLDKSEPPRVIVIEKPSWYRSMFYRALELLDFRKAVLGGFGGVVPEPSSG